MNEKEETSHMQSHSNESIKDECSSIIYLYMPHSSNKETPTTSSSTSLTDEPVLPLSKVLQNAQNELQLLQIDNLEMRLKTLRHSHNRHVANVAALKMSLDMDWIRFCNDLNAYNNGYQME